jgi:hypothetical protein
MHQPGDIAREGVPVGAGVATADVFEQFRVELGRVLPAAARVSVDGHVIRVHVQEDHTAVAGDPIELADPNVGVALAEEAKQGRVLGQGVR